VSEIQERLRETGLTFEVTRWILGASAQSPTSETRRIRAALALKQGPDFPFEIQPAPATGSVVYTLELFVQQEDAEGAEDSAGCGAVSFHRTKAIWELGTSAEDDAIATVKLGQAAFDRIWTMVTQGGATAFLTLRVKPIEMKLRGAFGATYTWDTEAARHLRVLGFDVAFDFQEKPSPPPDAGVLARLEKIDMALGQILEIQRRPLIDRMWRGGR
jgi:hypothetical protein